jgi:hypothetical protein
LKKNLRSALEGRYCFIGVFEGKAVKPKWISATDDEAANDLFTLPS